MIAAGGAGSGESHIVTKEPGHKINLDSFERPARAMHAIGG